MRALVRRSARAPGMLFTALAFGIGGCTTGGRPPLRSEAVRLPSCSSEQTVAVYKRALEASSAEALREGMISLNLLEEGQEVTLVPFEHPPPLRNRSEVHELMRRTYSSDLRDRGIEGSALVSLMIDVDGHVTRAVVTESSGHPELDRAARIVALGMKFEPVTHEDCRVRAWVTMPILFRST